MSLATCPDYCGAAVFRKSITTERKYVLKD